MVKQKNLEALNLFGGVNGIVASLSSDLKNGICDTDEDADLAVRREVFGANGYDPKPPAPSAKSFLRFFIEELPRTYVMILLFVGAAISIIFGIIQHGLRVGWHDGDGNPNLLCKESYGSPPPPPKGRKMAPAKVRRVPEVEFYHSLMRMDCSRRESGGNPAEALPATSNARDMIGEIKNRSTHLLAIKTDEEVQGDFIRFLIKEVENAAFTEIEDVVPFCQMGIRTAVTFSTQQIGVVISIVPTHS